MALWLSLAAGAASAQVPTWLRLLHWMSGASDQTSVPIMTMSDGHMQMSLARAPHRQDAERADRIVDAARAVLARYPDTAAAKRAGYSPFHETGELGEEVHYSSIGAAYAEGKHVDYARPGSILFRRTSSGMKAIGVMYSAPGQATADELDAIAPLSIATWHRHVDFCFPAGPHAKAQEHDPRFGYVGTIHTRTACDAAGGYWLPIAFGWMTHVYPDRRGHVWGGEEMDMTQITGAPGPAQQDGRAAGQHQQYPHR